MPRGRVPEALGTAALRFGVPELHEAQLGEGPDHAGRGRARQVGDGEQLAKPVARGREDLEEARLLAVRLHLFQHSLGAIGEVDVLVGTE